MKVKDHRNHNILQFRDGVELVDYALPHADDEYRMREVLCKIVGRMLDHMHLTDQQKLDIVVPYESWEVVE
jgi:hypothetical protein